MHYILTLELNAECTAVGMASGKSG